MQELELILLLEEPEIERKPRVTSTRTTGTEIAMLANWTILTRTSTCSIEREVPNMIDCTVTLWVEWVHLVEHHISFFLVALKANVKVL